MISDFPPTGPRLVRDAGEGRGAVLFLGTHIESTHLAQYIGEKVHVHDGYGENYEISEWRGGPRRHRRAGRQIMRLTVQDPHALRPRWMLSPKGGTTLLGGQLFVEDGATHDTMFGTFQEAKETP